MPELIELQIGDMSENGRVTIVDEDRLCYLVKSVNNGAVGLRTISKALLDEFVNYIKTHPGVSSNEVRNNISGQSDIDKYEYGYCATLVVMANMKLGNARIIKAPHQTSDSKSSIVDLPLQQIFYGAPGTGKSNTIKKEVDEKNMMNFRVTFHPDSDYSTFVGAYKPTMKRPEKVLKYDELIDRLSAIKTQGVTYPCHRFAAQYWESIKLLSAARIKDILLACGFPESMTVEIGKGVAIGEDYASRNSDAKITYEFVPQTFTNAYTAAWCTEEPVFLIIEEINRGNCAQIFGDLFQLLDRENGISEYPIKADTDLANHIAGKLANSTRDIPENVRSGEKLILPANLYIWATMNTSDQSLFPIDSAFKRRWDWKYVKIKNHPEENYQIKLSDTDKRDWWEFVKQVNRIIASMTSSADKQLGYFFCKADADKVISADKFVSKVLFYLWNDVFKDYGFEDASLFRYADATDPTKTHELTFPDFYDEKGEKVNIERVADFIDKVMAWDDNQKQA